MKKCDQMRWLRELDMTICNKSWNGLATRHPETLKSLVRTRETLAHGVLADLVTNEVLTRSRCWWPVGMANSVDAEYAEYGQPKGDVPMAKIRILRAHVAMPNMVQVALQDDGNGILSLVVVDVSGNVVEGGRLVCVTLGGGVTREKNVSPELGFPLDEGGRVLDRTPEVKT